jgi:hypothetical protein
MVGDDDSSYRANSRHGFRAKIDANIMTASDWPRGGKNNTKLMDKGFLDLGCPEVEEELADPTHRARLFARPLFGLATSKKTDNPYGFRKYEADALKRSFGYHQKVHRTLSFDDFRRQSNAVLQHRWNNHEHCGIWCRFSPDKPADERCDRNNPEFTKKYRNMDNQDDSDLLAHVMKITEHIFTDAALRQIHHPYDSQKNEALNTSVAKYAPKNKVYGRTPSLRSRVYFVGGVNSVGLHNFVARVSDDIGISNLPKSAVQFLKRRTAQDQKRIERERKTEVKKKRSANRVEKIRISSAEHQKDKQKASGYRSGMALDDQTDANAPTFVAETVKKKRKLTCSACGGDHRCDNKKKCAKYGPAPDDGPDESII